MVDGKWTADDVPDLAGKTMVVTGSNSGIGFEAARVLVQKGASVVMACRNLDKAGDAIERIQRDEPRGSVRALTLDLADLSSVRAFADRVRSDYEAIDVLVNNAGVMALPYRKTVDGFEMQIGTNHFGHFALTCLLLESLFRAPSARVVTVSSLAHRLGRIDFEDLDCEREYKKWSAYGQAKLANLLFAYALQRRFEKLGAPAISVACHPGYSATNLQLVGPQMAGSGLMEKLSSAANQLVAQDARMGALPTLYAATASEVQGGDFIGPGGFMEIRGYPVKVQSNERSHDEDVARRLWDVSAERTGVDATVLAP